MNIMQRYMTGKPIAQTLNAQERSNNTAFGRNGYHSVTATETTGGTYDGTTYEYFEADEETVCTFTNNLTGLTETTVTLAAGRYRWGLFLFDDMTVASGKLICYIYDTKA